MRALILNSGIGKRMGDITNDRPKCLIKIKGNETILYRQIKALEKNNITEIYITTGPFANEIQEYLACNFPHLHFIYIHNPMYSSTNYIYSMFLAKEQLKDDLILMHGDLVFDESLLSEIINTEYKNAVLLDTSVEKLPEKDFKGRIQNDLVKEISIHIFDEDCFFLIPIYKLSKELLENWLFEIGRFAQENKVNVYAEEALNVILKQYELKALYFKDQFCSEIDNLEDLNRVKEKIADI